MKIQPEPPFPPGTNVFLSDAYHMGQEIGDAPTGERLMIMYASHGRQVYIIVADERTGARLRIELENESRA